MKGVWSLYKQIFVIMLFCERLYFDDFSCFHYWFNKCDWQLCWQMRLLHYFYRRIEDKMTGELWSNSDWIKYTFLINIQCFNQQLWCQSSSPCANISVQWWCLAELSPAAKLWKCVHVISFNWGLNCMKCSISSGLHFWEHLTQRKALSHSTIILIRLYDWRSRCYFGRSH